MEIRHLEYFVVTADFGSTNQAAEALYTTQPNVSKVIASLEKELGVTLFARSNKGVKLTPQGEKIYDYAKNIIKNTNVMKSVATEQRSQKFSISCYPSHMLSRVFCDFYKQNSHNDNLEFFEGNVEEITDRVAAGLSEIGIVYIAQSQRNCFEHIIGHKKLIFKQLAQKTACIYVGNQNPLYNKKSIPFEELPNLHFVQPAKDFFSMEHHLDKISVGVIDTEQFHHTIHTNSDSTLINLLLHTDVCSFGIRFLNTEYEQYDIRAVDIENCEKFLAIGYIHHKEHTLSPEAKSFLSLLKKALKQD